jgi:hypothetical protein
LVSDLYNPRPRSASAPEDHVEIAPGLIHPEGSKIYSHGRLVSDDVLTHDIIEAGYQMLEQYSCDGQTDVTAFLRLRGTEIEHYVVNHESETVSWANNQSPESLYGLTENRKHNTLKEEYWTHMEGFPGTRNVKSSCVQQLKDVLSSLAVGMPLFTQRLDPTH